MRCIACGTETTFLEHHGDVGAAFCRQHLPEQAEVVERGEQMARKRKHEK